MTSVYRCQPGVSVAGTVVHFVETKLTTSGILVILTVVSEGLTKISKIFAFSAPFGKFSSILLRTPNSAQGGRFCAKYCARRIAESWHPYLYQQISTAAILTAARRLLFFCTCTWWPQKVKLRWIFLCSALTKIINKEINIYWFFVNKNRMI